MKSKAPFGKNTPLRKIEIFQGSTSTYRHPSTVIQPIVGAEVGKKLAEVGSKVAVDAIKAKSDKKPDGKTMIDSKGLQIPDIGDNLPKLDTKVPNLIGKSKSTSNTSDYYQKTVREILPTIGSYEGRKMSQEEWDALPSDTKRRLNAAVGADEEGNITKPGYRITKIEGKNQIAATQMKGSPAKQVDPYAAINPEAVPGTQAQNVLGAQPIVGTDLNQARNVDMQAMIDPYKSPGATFKPGEKLKAENIYGQAGQRQALMNLGSPMHAHTPTHGKKYKKGDLIDESDFETLGTGYNVQNISDIQEDKKGQFMTTLGDSEIYSDRPRPKSKKIDYPDPKGSPRDTIRPKVGKFFKRS